MKRRNVLLLLVVAALGITLANNNYQFQFSLVEQGQWVTIDEYRHDDPTTYGFFDQEPESTFDSSPIRQFGTASTDHDYVDSTQSTTYGTVTSGPPSGMGADSSAYTTLTEASYSGGYSYTTIEGTHAFDTTPSGWAFLNWQVTQGVARANYYSGVRYARSAIQDTSSYDATRITFDWQMYSGSATGYVLEEYTGSYSTIYNFPDKTGWQDVQLTGSTHSEWRVRWYADGVWSSNRLEFDNVLIEGRSELTYWRFQAVFKFSGVDCNYPKATLYVDFYSAASESLDFRLEEGSTSPSNLVASGKTNDFSVDITSYLSSGSNDVYLDIRDSYRSGDTSQTSFWLSRVYINLENNAPLNSEPAACVNLDNGDDILAEYRTYIFTCNVSDADGFDDIQYVDLKLLAPSEASLLHLRFNATTNTFSREGGQVPWQMDSGECDYVKSGNTIDISWGVTLSLYTNPTYREDFVDLRQYVKDNFGEYDEDTYDVNYDVVDSFEVLDFRLDDGVGTLDRGGLGTTDEVDAKGRVVYYGTTLAPPVTSVDVAVVTADFTPGTFTDNDVSYDNGYFVIPVGVADEVTQTTYQARVWREGESYPNQLYEAQYAYYITDRVVFIATTGVDWAIIGGEIIAKIYATYEYDGTPYTGTASWTDDTNGTVSHETVGKYWFYVTSFSDTTHGITAYSNTTAHCVWDDLEIASGPPYYWTQYSETAVWLIWGAPSTYVWSYNESLANDVRIQSLMNGTESGWSITDSGSIAGLAIGPFTPAWWYANITIVGKYDGYQIPVWSKILKVDILHSLQIVSFSIVPTDDYFWIQYQTNLMNASMTIWDDVVDPGTLFSSRIYYSTYEGMHQLPKDATVGVHNVTICITSTGSTYDRDYTFDYYTWWYNFTYVVQEDPSVYETRLVIIDPQGMELLYGTFEVYKNGTRVHSDTTVTYSNRAYNITVKDRWGLTLNATVFPAGDFEFAIEVQVHTLKVMSWHPDFVYVNLTRSGFTWREVICPTEIVSLYLFEGTYGFVVDYRNGSTVNGNINLVDSDALIVTGSTIADVAGYSATLLAMTTEINVTVLANNNYILELQVNLETINASIDQQLVYILLNITNIDSELGQQTIDLLAEIQNTNSTLYNQMANFIVWCYNNQTEIYSQTIDILSELNYVSSNVTANYISLSSELNLIDSNLAANFTQIVADLNAISSDVTSNYLSLAATLNAIDSSLLANFTSISATLSILDSSLLSNFTEVMSTLTAVGSNVTANYLSLSATLNAIDSSLLANFTSISATLSMLDSSLLSNFTEITSELYAVNSSIGSQFLSVTAALNMIDSSLLTNFTSISASLSLIDSSLLSNFTSLTAELYAVNSTIASEFLSITALLNMLDSNLLSNFTTLTAELYSVNSSIASEFLSVGATLSLIDSNLFSNFTEVTATLSAIDSNITSNYLSVMSTLSLLDSSLLANFTEITTTLSAINSNITANYLSLAATLSAIDSSLLTNFTSISASLSLIDSSLLSNFTTIVANLTAISSNITTNHLLVAAILTAIRSNITTNHLTLVALLHAIDSSISATEINIVAAIAQVPVFRGVTTSELINIISAIIGVEWLDTDGDGRPDTVSESLKDQLPKPQEDLPFSLIIIVILLVILAAVIRLGRSLAPMVYQMIKNSRSLNVQLANSKSK